MKVRDLQAVLASCQPEDEVCVVRYVPRATQPGARIVEVVVEALALVQVQWLSARVRRLVVGSQQDPWEGTPVGWNGEGGPSGKSTGSSEE